MRALLSVSDKTDLDKIATDLVKQEVELISTGGTKAYLEDHGFQVTGIEEVTEFPEILNGRVKTLHPHVHAGLLADRNNQEHMETLEKLHIQLFDFVIVNLYPFKETISQPDVSFADAIENIDIGGPSMLRSAAKNGQQITVIVDPEDYEVVGEELRDQGSVSEKTHSRLQAKAFRHTAAYDALIADYLTKRTDEQFPEKVTMTFEKQSHLRYGENSHQAASFYREPLASEAILTQAKQYQGKELSYNNIKDADAALRMVREFEKPTAVAVKHMNPCGIGFGDDIVTAFDRAYDGDPISIFGGIIALNRPVTAELAEKLRKIFLEIIIAPEYSDEALEILSHKKKVRVLELPVNDQVSTSPQVVSVSGGLLIQDNDDALFDDENVSTPTKKQPKETDWDKIRFGMQVVKHTKSNAIVLVNDKQTIGIGAGQMNRVGSAKIAIEEALDNGFDLSEAVLASDAFIPMPDTVELAAEYGIPVIVQPGGSIKDKKVIAAADEAGIAMVMTGLRHFKH